MSSAHDHDHHEQGHSYGSGHDHHDHHHGHDHTPKSFGSAFAVAVILQSTFVAVEIAVGLVAHSLAVLADAGHNVSDVLALLLAWGASRLGERRASKGRTYGLKSASILAALANAIVLVFVNGAVAWEAIGRLRAPGTVAANAIIAVSLAGVAVNAACALLLARGSNDLNVRAAFAHLASDAAVAGVVVVAGIAIRFTGLVWLDPVASLIVSFVVIGATWSMLRRAVDLALHAVPRGIDEDRVRAWLADQEGVASVHDSHIWAMSTKENILTAHLVMGEMPAHAFACELDERLRKAFDIHHVTLQLEPPSEVSCALLHHQPC